VLACFLGSSASLVTLNLARALLLQRLLDGQARFQARYRP
jgi:hypothetical protein